jgi:hypothetical protein
MGDIDRRENQSDDLIQGKTYVAALTIKSKPNIKNYRRDGARLQHFKRIDRSSTGQDTSFESTITRPQDRTTAIRSALSSITENIFQSLRP